MGVLFGSFWCCVVGGNGITTKRVVIAVNLGIWCVCYSMPTMVRTMQCHELESI